MVKVMTASGREVSVSGFKMPKQRKPQSLSQKLAKLEKQVKINQEEWKYIDVGFAATAVTGTLVLLNGCAPGDGASSRDGRQITIQSIQMKFRIECDATGSGANASTTGRFLVFVDKQSNGAAPNVGDVLDTSSTGFADALRNLNNRKRFKILMDRRYTVSIYSPGGIVDDFYIKRNGLAETVFNAGTAGTIADITSGSVYVMYGSDTIITPPSVVGNCRIRFTE